jgi:hydroxyacyl-ACP dehydratase HTD2-like protein with hotdog domain
MVGGENATFYQPVYDGDVVTCTRTIENIEEKHGRSGHFVLVTWKTTYTNQVGELLAEATASMIARP